MAVYALSDLHGFLDLYKQIKDFLQPEDIVYFLGDATDRGPQSWELAKAIYDDPQFIYLKGNHEDMLIKATLNYYGDEWDYENNYKTLLENGGIETWNSMLKYSEGRSFVYKLKDLPIEEVYYNKDGKEIHLCHAGFTPGRRRDLLWDRKHFFDIIDYIDDDYIIIHGHTPVFYQRKYETLTDALNHLYPEIYANGHKINIDMGTYNTHACILLDLDTFKHYLFTTKM